MDLTGRNRLVIYVAGKRNKANNSYFYLLLELVGGLQNVERFGPVHLETSWPQGRKWEVPLTLSADKYVRYEL